MRGAFVTHDPGSRTKTVGSNRGAAGPAAAVSQSQSNKWLYRDGTKSLFRVKANGAAASRVKAIGW